MYYRIFSKIYERAAKKMCQDCQDFIKQSSKILDLGCGSGIVAEALQNFFRAEIIGVDIQDKRVVNIPFQIIDGISIPFKENEFDICFISYVLHHSENPERLLEEAKRVSKGKIIIFEDLPEGIISKLICKIHSFTFNRFFQHQKTHLSFKPEKEWKRIFEEKGLNIIFKKRINNFPVKKKLFVLGV